jgi:hypothetical protein
MSIETTLTLGLAAAILVGALFIRVLVLSVVRLVLQVWHVWHPAEPRHRVPGLEQALPRVSVRERAASIGAGISAVSLYLAAQIASGTRFVVRNAQTGYAWAKPRVKEAFDWLLEESEVAYSGQQGRVTRQALGESVAPWGGRPRVSFTRR